MLTIAIDIGGTSTKLALVKEGEIVGRSKVPNHARVQDLQIVVDEVRSLLTTKGLSERDCSSVGISLPGIVDLKSKTLVSVDEKLSYAIGYDFQSWAKTAFGLPVKVENDARLALLGETAYGVAKGSLNAVIMILGTGIGTSAIVEGRLMRGVHSQAGILGAHFTVNRSGVRCNCGNFDCVEALASTWSLPRVIRSHPLFDQSQLREEATLDFAAVCRTYRSGDLLATEMIQHLVGYWSIAVVNLIHAYDPEIVVLSGGLMRSADLIYPDLCRYVAECAWTPWGKPEIRVATDVDDSVVKGLDFYINYYCS